MAAKSAEFNKDDQLNVLKVSKVKVRRMENGSFHILLKLYNIILFCFYH